MLAGGCEMAVPVRCYNLDQQTSTISEMFTGPKCKTGFYFSIDVEKVDPKDSSIQRHIA